MTIPDQNPSHRSSLAVEADSENPHAIRVYGARTHNLRNLHAEIPLDQLTVLTGVSGSGKSSLAFDTIYAEGRYRYLSSVSARSRELLQGIDRPDVDEIAALPPVLCVEQRLRGPMKRSTVATISEIHDYLRLLFARVGQLHCPTCHQPVTTQSRAQIVQQVLRLVDRQKVLILAPIVRGKTGTHADVFARIVKDGYVRARVDGTIVDVSAPPEIARTKPHDIDIVVDRLIIKEGIQSRLEESVNLALELGQGQIVISHEVGDQWQDRLFSSRLACATCGVSFPIIEPRLFSFNSPAGACPRCHGWGTITDADAMERTCDNCQGTRLCPLARSVLIQGTSLTGFCGMAPAHAIRTVEQWAEFHHDEAADKPGQTSAPTEQDQKAILRHLLPEIASRLRFLEGVGLGYLTLDRSSESLSAGELQRTRLAACLGSELTGVCYILDEPTRGLHPRDTLRLLQVLIRLRNDGNTVLLVEHDLDLIRAADHVIELGPGAGSLGGCVVATGTPEQLAGNPESVTGTFLNAQKTDARHLPSLEAPSQILRMTGATLHNLKSITIEVPLKRIVCVTGVSGSGKTSLVLQTLVPAIRRALGERIAAGGPFQELSQFDSITRLIRIDQTPLGRSTRSNPATYSGIWDGVRQVFAKTRESRLRGYTVKNFSLSVAEACCPQCAGRGELAVDEKRLSDWVIRCPACEGRRFSPATLSVRYRGRTVADVWGMSILEAAAFFENFPKLARILAVFDELGLGYLTLGQSARSLSGGEAQRIKLGTELAKTSAESSPALYVLDEPTAGLHPADIQHLVHVLRRLVDEGHSVLVIEHNPTLIQACDWMIELGPGSGPAGGQIVFTGQPADSPT